MYKNIPGYPTVVFMLGGRRGGVEVEEGDGGYRQRETVFEG